MELQIQNCFLPPRGKSLLHNPFPLLNKVKYRTSSEIKAQAFTHKLQIEFQLIRIELNILSSCLL